jgi:hypothetical protein
LLLCIFATVAAVGFVEAAKSALLAKAVAA